MPVCKAKFVEDFTIIPNTILRSKSLSYTAKGILCMMLSHREEWETTMEQLMEFGEAEINRKINLRKAFHQLEAAGYLKREHKRSGGRIVGVVWWWYPVAIPIGERSRPTDHSPKVGLPKVGAMKVSPPKVSGREKNKNTIMEENHDKEKRVLREEDKEEGFDPKSGEYRW